MQLEEAPNKGFLKELESERTRKCYQKCASLFIVTNNNTCLVFFNVRISVKILKM